MSHVAVLINTVHISGIDLSMADDSLAVTKYPSLESNLLRRISQGETERFADLIRKYQSHVARIVGRRVPADNVEETVHDVFVRAYVGLAQFSGVVSFDRWLAGIAVRACYDFWRERKGAELPVSALTEDHHHWVEQMLSAQSDDQFRNQAQKREAAEVLEWALKQLSPENRAVLTLVHLDGYSVREAAALLGWSLVNVKVRAHRGRQALRKVLSQILPGKR
jgi:RNA polymerase sigma-70 factor (ECF subfamily)